MGCAGVSLRERVAKLTRLRSARANQVKLTDVADNSAAWRGTVRHQRDWFVD